MKEISTLKKENKKAENVQNHIGKLENRESSREGRVNEESNEEEDDSSGVCSVADELAG